MFFSVKLMPSCNLVFDMQLLFSSQMMSVHSDYCVSTQILSRLMEIMLKNGEYSKYTGHLNEGISGLLIKMCWGGSKRHWLSSVILA